MNSSNRAKEMLIVARYLSTNKNSKENIHENVSKMPPAALRFMVKKIIFEKKKDGFSKRKISNMCKKFNSLQIKKNNDETIFKQFENLRM